MRLSSSPIALRPSAVSFFQLAWYFVVLSQAAMNASAFGTSVGKNAPGEVTPTGATASDWKQRESTAHAEGPPTMGRLVGLREVHVPLNAGSVA
jgi:hypothetical protein